MDYLDIPMREYNAIEAERSSGLKWLLPPSTPADYWEHREGVKDTPAMRLGRITHAIVANSFREEFYIAPAGVGRRDRRWRGLALSAGTKELVATDEVMVGQASAVSVMGHPVVKEILALKDVGHERSMVVGDKETGLRWKARPDIHSEFESIVLDIKSTSDIASAKHQIRKMNYDMQLAMQRAAFGAERAAWVYVESVRPHKVRVIEASQGMLEIGWHKFEYCMSLLASCLESGKYPGYPETVETMEPMAGEIQRWSALSEEGWR